MRRMVRALLFRTKEESVMNQHPKNRHPDDLDRPSPVKEPGEPADAEGIDADELIDSVRGPRGAQGGQGMGQGRGANPGQAKDQPDADPGALPDGSKREKRTTM